MTAEKIDQNIFVLVRALFRYVNKRRKGQLGILLVLAILSSFAEVLSLGAVVPFIGVLTQPEVVYNEPRFANIMRWLEITSPEELVLPLALGFAFATLVAGSLRLVLLWINIKLGNLIGADLGIKIFKRTLLQPYELHIDRNSSSIISTITQKVSAATSVLLSLVNVVTSGILFTAIFITLVAIDPFVALVACLSFGSSYFLIAWITRNRLVVNSEHIAREQTMVVKSLQEGLGSIRDIILDGTHEVFSQAYQRAIHQLRISHSENTFINQAPRYVMEALGIVLIVVLSLSLYSRPGGIAGALPILGLLALGAQRLLPLMQQLYGNWSVLSGSKAAIMDVIDFLEIKVSAVVEDEDSQPISMERDISFEKVSFRYKPELQWVLKNIGFSIRKGQRVGIIGRTGSGKSTLLDLFLGLLSPTQGEIRIDGVIINEDNRRKWQGSIAHVPQSIYLTDGTITENIAFGVPADRVDNDRVVEAARQASLLEFIDEMPENFQTRIGERGVRLSGGQRQRIGIARALYKKATVLYFDEATSSLDDETERNVMQSIEMLSEELTIIIVAHRISTLSGCDAVYRVDNGGLTLLGDFESLSQL